jgi:hypothetical protein
VQLLPDGLRILHPLGEKSNAIGNFDIRHILTEISKVVTNYEGPAWGVTDLPSKVDLPRRQN